MSPWYVTPVPVPEAVARLVCLPHAGAGAGLYGNWAEYCAARSIEVTAVRPPGRESRISEDPISDMVELVRALTIEFDALTPRLPYALFGSCGGALIAYELARSLDGRGHRALALYVCGSAPPHLISVATSPSELTEAGLVEALRKFGGTSSEVLADPELLELLLPVLRADLALVAAYRQVESEPLPMPIRALRGLQDPAITAKETREWRRHTEGEFQTLALPGDHFRIVTDPESACAVIAKDIASLIQQASPPTARN